MVSLELDYLWGEQYGLTRISHYYEDNIPNMT